MNKTIKNAIEDLEIYLYHRYDDYCEFHTVGNYPTKEDWESYHGYETRKTINELKEML